MKMKKKILSAIAVLSLVAGFYTGADAQPEYTNMMSSEALEMIRHESALVGENNHWRSPLAEKYDGAKVQISGRITELKELPDGTVCLYLDYYKSEHQEVNWKRVEDFKVKVKLDKQAAASKNISGYEFIVARGTANIDYVWSDMHIDKHDQKSLRILANFQGNGRGYHVYSFEVLNAEIVEKR